MKFLNSIQFLIICVIAFSTTQMNAQIHVPGAGTGINPQGSFQENVIITHENVDWNQPTPTSVWNELQVKSKNVDYGNSTAIYARSTADGGAGPTTGVGVTRSYASYISKYNSGTRLRGIIGVVDSVSLLDVFNNTTSSGAIGGDFTTTVDDPLVNPTVGIYTIAGSKSTLRGNMTSFPTTGVVSALVAIDEIQGASTWAGHFDGRGYFSQNVGIANDTPQSLLSVNGVGDSRFTSYAYTDATTSGNAAVVGEAARPTGFSDNVIATRGFIESGRGFTFGLHGSAITSTPSSDGRAYGVYGQAGNADINYGVYGGLTGTNKGAAVFGSTDAFSDGSSLINGRWAGYFVGDAQVTDRLGINCTNLNPSIIPATGTTYRLIVNGGILGTELFINNTAWCDYVFENDYQLTSLEEVDAHIQEKGHLHNTPSAQSIETAGGIEIGEMTRNQQEKIEEIYLHLIDLNKEIKKLKAENLELKSQLTEK